MSFNNALSGVNAAQKDLNVTANNISNVNTIGFKESRAEFADVYANSIFANGKTQVGNGVATAAVAQQFHQGPLSATQNPFDLAIQGNGFFVLSDSGSNMDRTFTRAGAFKLDDDSYITNNQGKFLQGYAINQDGTPKAVSLNATQPIQIPDRAGEPKQTTKVEGSFNLSSSTDNKALDPASFDPADSSTYNHSTSVIVYDSLGSPHTITQYFVRQQDASNPGTPQDPPTWQMFMYEGDGDKPIQVQNDSPTSTTPLNSVTMTFTSGGKLSSSTPSVINTVPLGSGGAGIIDNGADPTQTFELALRDVTQYSSAFEVNKLSQDGATVGRLTKVEITEDGIVAASYSNATTVKVAMVAMAKFANSQGLTQAGDTSWQASLLSGDAQPGTPSSGSFGSVKSSFLEQSNVDLTSQLVNLITAQRNFQANSRALEVNSTLQQTILQIR